MARTQGLSDLLDLYRPIWLFSGALLLTLFCSRAALIATHWDRVSAVANLTTILIQGLRFDLIELFSILALPLIGHPLFCQYRGWRKIITIYFARISRAYLAEQSCNMTKPRRTCREIRLSL